MYVNAWRLMSTEVDALYEREARETLGGIYVGPRVIRRALVLSLWDGITATVMIALTETFGIAAAVSLHAPSMAIALLSSTPLLLGSLGQYFLPQIVELDKPRKFYVLRGVALQSLFLFFAAFAGFLGSPYAAWAYVAAVVMAGVSANVTGASWVSWVGDLVPLEVRGRHFAWRSRVFSFVNLSCALLAGLLAKDYTSHNAPWAFFTAVFLCASSFRFVSFQMLTRQYEPPLDRSLQDRTRAVPSRHFIAFSLTQGFLQGAAAMSAPFFSVWYLRDLHFNYFSLAVAACCTIAGSIISLPLWGHLADHVGNRRVLQIAGFLVSFMPLPYLFFTKTWTIWVFNLVGGISWAGYNLASFNHLLGASEKQDRTRLIAFASAVTGVLVFMMTLLGGVLSTRMPQLFEWPLQSLFLVSSALRVTACLILFPHIGDDAHAPVGTSQDLFNQLPGYRVGLGLLRNFFRAFRG
jgi:MFS family permease